MSSKSKANCSASMVAATVGRAGPPDVGTLFVVRPFPPSETPFSFVASASSGVPAPIPSRAIRSSSSSVNCSRTSWRVPPSCMMICAASSRSWEPKSTSDAAAEDVEGVVPKESQESGPSKMPSLIRVSSFTVTLGPSRTRPSSSNQSSRQDVGESFPTRSVTSYPANWLAPFSLVPASGSCASMYPMIAFSNAAYWPDNAASRTSSIPPSAGVPIACSAWSIHSVVNHSGRSSGLMLPSISRSFAICASTLPAHRYFSAWDGPRK